MADGVTEREAHAEKIKQFLHYIIYRYHKKKVFSVKRIMAQQ